MLSNEAVVTSWSQVTSRVPAQASFSVLFFECQTYFVMLVAQGKLGITKDVRLPLHFPSMLSTAFGYGHRQA